MLITLGYEGRDLDEIVRLLREHGVEVLVDVRATPRSRKPGLSRTRLSEAVEATGITYRHEPRLGVPREEREAFRAGDPDAITRYRDRIAGDDRETTHHVAELARDRRVALLCYERDEQRCHRRLVVEAVRVLAPDIEHVALP